MSKDFQGDFSKYLESHGYTTPIGYYHIPETLIKSKGNIVFIIGRDIVQIETNNEEDYFYLTFLAKDIEYKDNKVNIRNGYLGKIEIDVENVPLIK